MTELTAPLVLKNKEKKIVYGPVLIPDEPDHDSDLVLAEKIEEVAHKFHELYGNIDLQNSLNNVGKVRGGHTAIHNFSFAFVVMVHDLNATQGKDSADDLAFLVYDVISTDGR
ncbi:Putative phage serine protease XkdF [Seinonella peptonophila]|uniref:Putative phage serine protease XkdF n=1 Tax=Seinonella peptonophila TaxID=112248 RepID=A0A1M5ARB1_9BACL|nr:XkdF-like putative serine protease domain-containing protein [Seinonella peptonophila]SHF32714.1 Putative phage serine protease XkdF [Seinonella peptonophila]